MLFNVTVFMFNFKKKIESCVYAFACVSVRVSASSWINKCVNLMHIKVALKG